MKQNEDIKKIISSRKKELEKLPYYINHNKKYNTLYESFEETLTEEQKKKFSQIINLKDTITSYENYVAYKIGFADGVKYHNTKKE